jgi:phosphate transport system substrate-binding protein
MEKLKKLFVLLALVLAAAGLSFAAEPLLINGAGSTFAYPIYSKWFFEYAKIDPSVNFNYQSIGSVGGIKQFTLKTVDFGATDGPMTEEQMKAAPGEVLHLPMVGGAVAIAYNMPGITERLRFSPAVLSGIWLGKITKWTDKKIAKDNPGVKFPDQDIVVVHRSEGSGTTYIFTDYLSEISKEWKEKVGKSVSVNWPVGLGGKGSEGVAGLIQQTPYSICYVELAYAMTNKIAYGEVKNSAGRYILPTLETTTEAIAAKAKHMPDDYRVSVVNPSNPKAYPIAGLTWIIVYKHQTDKVRGEKLVQFLTWGITEGQQYAADLLYASLPANVVEMLKKTIKTITY